MKWFCLIVALLAPVPAAAQALVVATCGSPNYTSMIGQLHQLTMNTAGYLCVTTTATLLAAPPPAPPAPEPPEVQKP